MRPLRNFWLATSVMLALIVGIILVAANSNGGKKAMPDGNVSTTTDLQIVSPAFRDGAAIPIQYTCRGQNVNPPLNFISVPSGTRSLTLIMHDPEAPVGDYVHWIVWDIPASTETVAVNSVPVGAVQGLNSNGQNGYIGPCPPSGTHRYMFELYTLDSNLSLPANTTRDQLVKAMQGHVIEQHTLTGLFSA